MFGSGVRCERGENGGLLPVISWCCYTANHQQGGIRERYAEERCGNSWRNTHCLDPALTKRFFVRGLEYRDGEDCRGVQDDLSGCFLPELVRASLRMRYARIASSTATTIVGAQPLAINECAAWVIHSRSSCIAALLLRGRRAEDVGAHLMARNAMLKRELFQSNATISGYLLPLGDGLAGYAEMCAYNRRAAGKSNNGFSVHTHMVSQTYL